MSTLDGQVVMKVPEGTQPGKVLRMKGKGIPSKEVRAKGGTILTETPVKKLLVENGKVVGVEAVDAEGDKVIVKAKKVILATGGFESNKEMLAKYVNDSSALGMFEPVWYRGPVTDGKNGDGRTQPCRLCRFP